MELADVSLDWCKRGENKEIGPCGVSRNAGVSVCRCESVTGILA